jgi:chorismate--pyruvate lyase
MYKQKMPVEPIFWQPLSAFESEQLPYFWYQWLSDRGSLTSSLVKASGNRFSVKVLSQREDVPLATEAQALNITVQTPVLVRQVILYGDHIPWVFARSIMPLTTLTGRVAELRNLDNQPLGARLFSDSSMSRETVEVAYFNAQELAVPIGVSNSNAMLWGRRSVFRLDQKPLLVSEIFLSTFEPNGSDDI